MLCEGCGKKLLDKQETPKLLDIIEEFENANPGKYPTQMLRDFVDYWGQQDARGTELWLKERKRKAFDINLRLATWSRKTWRK